MSITRAEILRRAETVWGGFERVPYSQSTLHQPDGYRCDCSGYVAASAGIPASVGWGGPNTVTLVTDGWIHEINPNDLKPGDFIGRCGAGTAGDAGHIRIFVSWDNQRLGDNGHAVYEQTGGSSGPHKRHYATWPSGYKAYRLNGVVDTSPAPPFPLPGDEWFGDIKGPAASHGGFYKGEQGYVRQIQDALNRKGFGPVAVDGVFGPQTIAAVTRFQHAQMPGTQFFGQVWADDWAKLLG